MPCPTCSETMQCVVNDPSRVIHWCPRCGTLATTTSGEYANAEAPKLVDRCRLYWNHVGCLNPDPWHSTGIAEAIDLPGDRP